MKDKLKIDIRLYLPCLGNHIPLFEKYYHQKTNRVKMQGCKIFTDGSIQGYTGYLTEPYFVQPEEIDHNIHQN